MAKQMLPDPDPTSVSEARAYRREKLLEAARKAYPRLSDKSALEWHADDLVELAHEYHLDGDKYEASMRREDSNICRDMAEEMFDTDD